MYNGGPHAKSINLGILVFALHEYLHQQIVVMKAAVEV